MVRTKPNTVANDMIETAVSIGFFKTAQEVAIERPSSFVLGTGKSRIARRMAIMKKVSGMLSKKGRRQAHCTMVSRSKYQNNRFATSEASSMPSAILTITMLLASLVANLLFWYFDRETIVQWAW